MAIHIEMPKLSDTMTEGTLVKWHKQPGDRVEIGDVIAEVETDKATMEMEAFDEGILLEIRVHEGEKVPIGGVLAILGAPGEATAQPAAQGTPSPPAPPPVPAAAPPPPVPPPVPPAAPPPAAAPAVPPPADGGRIKASPLARKVAADLGVDLSRIAGSGPAGRIVRVDVEAAAKTSPAKAPSPESLAAAGLAAAARSRAAQAPPAAAAQAPPAPAAPAAGAPAGQVPAAPAPAPAAQLPAAIQPVAKEGDERLGLGTIRRIVAERLLTSKLTIPHFYLHLEADAAPLLTLRAQINAQAEKTHGNKYSVNDFVLKAVIEAVKAVPAVNSAFAGDAIIRFAHIGLAVAIAVDDGLVTPVIKDAGNKSLLAISREVKDLAARAKERRLRPDEFDAGTITVSSLGAWGIESFDPIINPPQAAIVAVGAAAEKPVVRDGQVVPGTRINLGLACDHRVVDGAIAAGFLTELRRLVEQPALMLI